MRDMRTRGGIALALAGTMALTGASLAVAQDEETEIAYMSASSANTWLGASKAVMDEIAAENNMKLVEFDAQFDAGLQTTQLQDVLAANRYDGMIVVALAGSAVFPDLEAASEAGIKIVALNQVAGDALDTADPQHPSISAAVMAPPARSGERLGKLTLKACEDKDPCNVVYIYGIKGIPLDVALKESFDSVTAGSTVNVVAEGEGGYLGPDDAYVALQDILIANPDFDVVVGSDQSMQGAELALDEAGALADVDIIGFGGSSPAIAAVADGRWFGDLMGAPVTEGRLAMEAMIAALAGEDLGGFDPALELQDEGLITAENVADFTAEWDG
jgi:ribose transport system substrate-binding protein